MDLSISWWGNWRFSSLCLRSCPFEEFVLIYSPFMRGWQERRDFWQVLVSRRPVIWECGAFEDLLMMTRSSRCSVEMDGRNFRRSS